MLLRYSVNQGEDIWTQLLFGMRYLDLRVGIVSLNKVTSLLASQLYLHASYLCLFSVHKDPLQVSYYEDTPEKFWLVHDFVKQNPL